MTNKEKFLALVSDEKTNIFEEIAYRRKNRSTIRQSQDIALKVLLRLEFLGWSKRDLAKRMQVSPQQVSKVVRGTENLTLKTIVKLQEVLEIPLLASYYENNIENLKEEVGVIQAELEEIKSKVSSFSTEVKNSESIYSFNSVQFTSTELTEA